MCLSRINLSPAWTTRVDLTVYSSTNVIRDVKYKDARLEQPRFKQSLNEQIVLSAAPRL